jgi:hypothetical protein
MPAIRFHGFHHGHGAYQGAVLDGRPWQPGHVEEIPGDKAAVLLRDFAGHGPGFGDAFTEEPAPAEAPEPPPEPTKPPTGGKSPPKG